MAKIENAFMIFAVFIMAINAMFMFMTYLPNNVQGTSTYQFGIPTSKQNEIQSWFTDLEQDMNALSNSTTGVTGSTEARSDIDLLGALLGGLGLALNAPSLILNFVNFFLMIMFGFWYWIDYFFAPIILGFAGFAWIALIIKGLLLVIQLIGLVFIFMMIYSGFRK